MRILYVFLIFILSFFDVIARSSSSDLIDYQYHNVDILNKSSSLISSDVDSNSSRNQKLQLNLLTDIFEISKIVLMSTLLSVSYGIIHDLITVHIDFDYFSSDRTHHGPFTRENFPSVYKSNNKVLYALLWGTIATFWVGAISGVLWGIATRINSDKLNWRDLVVPASIVSCIVFFSSLIIGANSYQKSSDSFFVVTSMHNWSYLAVSIGCIGILIYSLTSNKKKKSNDIIKIDHGILSINLFNLFYSQ
jgi:hypothetical protein